MTSQYLVHLPDGSEYGPIDRATLAGWRDEGRLPADALVWPEGAPEWVSVDAALEEAAPNGDVPAAVAPAVASGVTVAPAPSEARPVAAPASLPPSAPVPLSPSASIASGSRPGSSPGSAPGDGAVPPAPRVARAGAGRPARARGPALSPRLLAGALGGLLVLAALVAGLGLLRPWLAKRAEVAAVKGHALPDRRIEDTSVGLVADLPPRWVALRPDNPYVTAPDARLRLADPSVPVFASVRVATRPRHMDALDAYLDELLQDRVPRQPSMTAGGRADVQLGRGKGRLVRTTWEEDLVPMQGETVVWADGYQIFTLDASAPAAAGARLSEDVAELCRGLSATGLLEGRVADAVEQLSLDVPELSREALRLLVAERMSQGRDLADVPQAALRMVSRGLDALAPGEAAEMRAIYQQVWAPVAEADRVRSAALLAEIKAGRPVPAEALAALRSTVKTGVLALPPEQRARLQELSSRAVRQSLLLP